MVNRFWIAPFHIEIGEIEREAAENSYQKQMQIPNTQHTIKLIQLNLKLYNRNNVSLL